MSWTNQEKVSRALFSINKSSFTALTATWGKTRIGMTMILSPYFADEILRIRTQLQRIILRWNEQNHQKLLTTEDCICPLDLCAAFIPFMVKEGLNISSPVEGIITTNKKSVLPKLPVTAVRTSLSIWYLSLWSSGRIFSRTLKSGCTSN